MLSIEHLLIVIDLGWYAFLDILTVIPVQMIFAERSIKVNNKSLPVIIFDAFLM